MEEIIYFMGWNKRIELTKDDKVFVYSERNTDGSSIRLRCDMSDRRMVVEKMGKNEEEFVEMNIIRDMVVDLGNHGEHWEGELVNGLPFGYGCVYNDLNELVYSGFMYEGERVCFGEEFRDSKVAYSGTFYKNQRHGIGKLYDSMGELVYEGNWYFGKNVIEDVEVIPELGDSIIHDGMRKLVIADGYHCNLKELHLTDFSALENISVGDNCFSGVEMFEISNCLKLERIVIGKKSFYDETCSESKGTFLVHDCGNLRELSIDNNSYSNYNLILESMLD